MTRRVKKGQRPGKASRVYEQLMTSLRDSFHLTSLTESVPTNCLIFKASHLSIFKMKDSQSWFRIIEKELDHSPHLSMATLSTLSNRVPRLKPLTLRWWWPVKEQVWAWQIKNFQSRCFRIPLNLRLRLSIWRLTWELKFYSRTNQHLTLRIMKSWIGHLQESRKTLS